jgi:hypothetical protein
MVLSVLRFLWFIQAEMVNLMVQAQVPFLGFLLLGFILTAQEICDYFIVPMPPQEPGGLRSKVFF